MNKKRKKPKWLSFLEGVGSVLDIYGTTKIPNFQTKLGSPSDDLKNLVNDGNKATEKFLGKIKKKNDTERS